MEEQQINPVPLVTDAEPPLSTDEREVGAELEQERLELLDQCPLEIALRSE